MMWGAAAFAGGPWLQPDCLPLNHYSCYSINNDYSNQVCSMHFVLTAAQQLSKLRTAPQQCRWHKRRQAQTQTSMSVHTAGYGKGIGHKADCQRKQICCKAGNAILNSLWLRLLLSCL